MSRQSDTLSGSVCLEKSLYLVFVLDVRLCVRMKHELETELASDCIGKIVDGVDQKLPRV